MSSHRTSSRPLLATAGCLLVALASAAPAAGAGPAATAAATRYTAADSRITVAGTSNLHDWTVEARGMGAALTLPAGFLDGEAEAMPRGTFTLPAKSLTSDKDRMNQLMWKALRAGEAPELVFELREARRRPGAGGGLEVEVTGVLTVAGKPRPTTLKLTVRRQGERLLVAGELPLAMSDFGISPPTALLGTLKTGDRVVVTLEATLVPAGG